MTSIATRAALVAERLSAIRNHPMCADFVEDRSDYYVTYPAGDFPVHGLRASKAGGKGVALGRLLTIMEQHWRESYPSPIGPN